MRAYLKHIGYVTSGPTPDELKSEEQVSAHQLNPSSSVPIVQAREDQTLIRDNTSSLNLNMSNPVAFLHTSQYRPQSKAFNHTNSAGGARKRRRLSSLNELSNNATSDNSLNRLSSIYKSYEEDRRFISLNQEIIKIGRSDGKCDITFSELDDFGDAAMKSTKVLSRLHATITRLKLPPTPLSYVLESDIGSGSDDETDDMEINAGTGASNEQGAPMRLNRERSSRRDRFSWTIIDHGSMNGTFVNGTRLQPEMAHLLVKNDTVSFGPLNSGIEWLLFRFVVVTPEILHDPPSIPMSQPIALIASVSNAESGSLTSPILSPEVISSAAYNGQLEDVLKNIIAAQNSLQPSGLQTLSDVNSRKAMLQQAISLLSQQLDDGAKPITAPLNEDLKNQMVSSGLPMSMHKKEGKPKSTGMLSDLRRELTCSICCEMFLFASTLTCGHSFCKGCIDKWLQSSLTCPLCRKSLTRIPVHSHAIDKTIQVVLSSEGHRSLASSNSGSDCASDSSDILTGGQLFEQRKAEYENETKMSLARRNKLVELLNEAKTVGYSLVHVSKPWSEREQTRFLQGIKAYFGPSRMTYCEAVNLTGEFINKATTPELITACVNLQLAPLTGRFLVEKGEEVDFTSWAEEETGNVRDRLTMFIHYG